MRVVEAINSGVKFLKESKISTYVLDTEILLSKTLNKSREEILINLDKQINEEELLIFNKYLNRRSKNEPIAYILEEKEFWSKRFFVNKATLIPRPETELLVNVLSEMYNNKKITILDIGTGSGCIILSLLSELKTSMGVGVDISKKAISVAKKNATRLHLLNRVKLQHRSFESIVDKKFDLIVSNPPYIVSRDIKYLSNDIKKYEPKIALDGGNDGLDLIKKVIYKSKNILKIKGTLALEIGNEQIKKVSKILVNNNFKVKRIINDYKHNTRGVVAVYN